MEKRDKSLLSLENKIGNFNEKENILKNFRINKPNMNMNQFSNNKFNKENLLSFLDKFKKENEKIMNDENKIKYNIEKEEIVEEEENEEENEMNKEINLDEDKEDENNNNQKNKKKKKGEKIELDLLMGILEQQNKKEISIENIIENKKNANIKEESKLSDKNKEEGEKEIINFLQNKD